MLTGQVGCVVDSRGWMGKAIEDVTDSRAHHVIIAISETHCISAEPGGARIRPIADYEHVIWSRYEHTEEQAHFIAGLAEYSQHVRYDYLSFIALGWHFLTGAKIPDKAATWLDDRGETTCSQLASNIMRTARISAPTTTVVCPGDWLNYIQTHHM
jgi:hypothetical protein